MTPTRKFTITAGVLVFVLGVIVIFPARVAYNGFAPDVVQMSGLHGTAWSGSAAEMSVSGVYLRDVAWQVKPLRLLTGKVALDLEATPTSGFVEASVALGFGGVIRVSNLSGSVPLQLFAGPLRMPGLAGNSSLQFESIVVRDGIPTEVEGTFAVASLVAPMIDSNRTQLGSYRAEFMTTESGVIASVEDSGAVFDLAGSLTLSPDRSFLFLGQVAATDQTPEKLRQQLRFLGTPNERGQHEVRFEGSL